MGNDPGERRVRTSSVGRGSRRKNDDNTFTIYGFWAYPDTPIVPAHLRGATTLIRFNSTPEEIAAGRRRTRAGRTIPPNDPDFPRNYGGRNQTENRHHQLKLKLPNKRLNVVGLERVERRMVSRYLAKNLEAAIAWQERTGGDISHLFTEPPPLAYTA